MAQKKSLIFDTDFKIIDPVGLGLSLEKSNNTVQFVISDYRNTNYFPQYVNLLIDEYAKENGISREEAIERICQ